MSGLDVFDFRVAGLPIPQGSMTARVVKGRAILYSDNDRVLKPWRRAVTAAAAAALPGDWRPLDEPLRVVCLFAMPKPKGAPKRRRIWPMGQGTGDIDKLARAVLDSLTTAKVWRDDARVVDLHAIKDYPCEDVVQHTPGVFVVVSRVVKPADELPIPTTEGTTTP